MRKGLRRAQGGASPPVGVRSSSVVQRRAAFAVSLVDARPGGHQGHCALVATVGSCIVQWGPGEHSTTETERLGGGGA